MWITAFLMSVSALVVYVHLSFGYLYLSCMCICVDTCTCHVCALVMWIHVLVMWVCAFVCIPVLVKIYVLVWACVLVMWVLTLFLPISFAWRLERICCSIASTHPSRSCGLAFSISEYSWYVHTHTHANNTEQTHHMWQTKGQTGNQFTPYECCSCLGSVTSAEGKGQKVNNMCN